MEKNMFSLEKLVFSSLDDLNHPIYIVNDEGGIVYANKAASEYIGYSVSELLKMNVYDIDVNDTSFEKFQKQWLYMQTDEFRKEKSFETIHRSANGKLIPVEVSPALFEHNGKFFSTTIIKNIENDKESADEIALLQNLINNSHDMVFAVRMSDGFIVYANHTAFSKLGYSLEELQKIGVDGFRVSLKEEDDYLAHSKELEKAGTMVDRAMLKRKDGSMFHIEARLRVLTHNGEDYNMAIVSDTSQLVEKEKKLIEINNKLDELAKERTYDLSESISVLESYKKAIDLNSIVSKTDKDGYITYVNENFCNVSGYSAEEAVGSKHNINRHPDNSDQFFKKMWITISAKKPWNGIIKNLSKNGDTYYISAAILPILNSNGDIIEYIAICHDITELINQKDSYRTLLLFDTLTGYGNRHKLVTDVANENDLILCLVDINKFNTINDFYGLEYGDSVIIKFGRFLHDLLDTKCELYRVHGDQFAVKAHKSEKEELISTLRSCIDYFTNNAFIVNGKRLTFSITVSASSEPSKMLISSCDLARRYAKKYGYDFIEYSSSLGIENNISENLKSALLLQNAYNEDRVLLYFQPISNSSSGKIYKYECLVRIEDENGNILPPLHFLETAKNSRLYGRLSQIIITKAFEMAEKHPEVSFSINITIEDIMDYKTNTLIIDKLQKASNPGKIIFEIVESEEMRLRNDVLNFFTVIKSMGARIAIDDFGTGYSNFEYLLTIKADFVKIDGSLIKNIHKDESTYAIVKLVIDFAKQSNMKTIAEFVSDVEVCEILQNLKIDYLQGYLIGKPLPTLL